VQVSELSYAPPGRDTIFFDLSFSLSIGDHAGLIGDNGLGKTTILRILTGELAPDDGETAIGGSFLYLRQDIGFEDPEQSIREMLLEVAPTDLRSSGEELLAAERSLSDDPDAGVRLSLALSDWGDRGGYELEQQWDRALTTVVGTDLQGLAGRRASELSGGERKRVLLEILLRSTVDILLLDEPDNYLDIPGKLWLERALQASPKTILLVSHDRALLGNAVDKLIVLEGGSCWIHHGTYSSFPAARDDRHERLGDELRRWNDEERRLYRHYKIMKQRAAVNFKNAPKANAAESRWKRFMAKGPPEPPPQAQKVGIRLRGGDSARRAVVFERYRLGDLIRPFSEEITFGEHVGLIGPNGAGKTQLLRSIAHARLPSVRIGNRVSAGLFTQVGDRPDFGGRQLLDIVGSRGGGEQVAMSLLARYGLQREYRQEFETLSGGQKARLEILWLEVEGSNLLLLDEPTDHLDIDSSEALEAALDTFVGTVLAVSHDRAFLARLDRFLMLMSNGDVYALPDFDTALEALQAPGTTPRVKLARRLTLG